MPDIKLRDSSGVETTYENVNTIEVPLADGSGTQIYSNGDWYDGALEIGDINSSQVPLSVAQKIIDLYWEAITIGTMEQPIRNSSTYFTNTFKYDASDKTNYYKFSGTNNRLTEINSRFPSKIVFVDTFLSWGAGNGGGAQFCGSKEAIEQAWSEVPDSIFYCFWVGRDGVYNYVRSCETLPERWLKIPLYFDSINYANYNNYKSFNSSWNPYYYLFNINNSSLPSFNLKEIDGIEICPMACNGTAYIAGEALHKLTFATDNGVPRKAIWSGATLKFGQGSTGNSNNKIGYCGKMPVANSYKTNHAYEGTLFSDHIITDELTYQLYKNEYDRVVYQGNDGTYTNSVTGVTDNGYFGLLFSNYNHDRMVETINSLPDLMEAGTTCTISFHNKLGKLTNEGGFDNLTEEEIAVAVNKGWTVTSHTS